MIKSISYSINSSVFIQAYDETSHQVWAEKSAEILAVRSEVRKHYLSEQKYTCAYCKCIHHQSHGMSWDIDHIIPKSKYPKYLFEPLNLIVACKDCNTAKGDYDALSKLKGINKSYPADGTYFDIIHPHYDSYDSYIEVFIAGKRRIYIPRFGHKKAINTITHCDLIRYSWKFADAPDFRDDVVSEVYEFVDSCGIGDSAQKIQSQMRHLKFN